MTSTHRKSSHQEDFLLEAFHNFILGEDHPCIMAKSATQFDRVLIKEYKQLGTLKSAEKMYKDMLDYIENHDFESNQFESFMATFPEEAVLNEKQFESKLWRQLSLLHHVDKKPWDDTVSNNPESTNFSFSVGGTAFYIIGLHPNSSRSARQFQYPALVFNFHHQFEKLRDMGTFKKVRNTIRERDRSKNGTINPMVKDFGSDSEARQYSGRAVDEKWECPFKHTVGNK